MGKRQSLASDVGKTGQLQVNQLCMNENTLSHHTKK